MSNIYPLPETNTSIQAAPAAASYGDYVPRPTGLNFQEGVNRALSRMTAAHNAIDQVRLRYWLSLSPSFLMLDVSTTSPPTLGIERWKNGLHSLVNVVVALHAKDQLEFETIDEAARALAQCWSITLGWTGMDYAQVSVQQVGEKLTSVLDIDDRSRYKGRVVWTQFAAPGD